MISESICISKKTEHNSDSAEMQPSPICGHNF